jgi:hypothetical protein
MGMGEFSNIGSGGRDDKNTTLISGMSDRYFVLRFLNWIKSSKESESKFSDDDFAHIKERKLKLASG